MGPSKPIDRIARRAEGASKHLLQPDPVRGPVVTTIFMWRVTECLGYQAIADRLNAGLDWRDVIACERLATAKKRAVQRDNIA
ncbi:hypothetical protein SMC26_00755 [Actinomadura fulvescens]|uniref:Transposase n=1 Tax=Actinomadura fulvescens TaxID=46160 RepID=A0ABN3PPQ5_9ACTN